MSDILTRNMLLRLKEYRKAQCMSQAKFAGCIDVSQTYYSQVECGEISLSYSILDRLYDRNCDIDYIVTGTKRNCEEKYLSEILDGCVQEKRMYLYTLMIMGFMYMWDWNLDDHWEKCLYSELRAVSNLATTSCASFEERLLYVRMSNGTSQQELADMLGIGRTKCGQCERGEKKLDAQLMLSLYLEGYCIPSFFFEEYIGIAEITSLLESNSEKKSRYNTYIQSVLSNIVSD